MFPVVIYDFNEYLTFVSSIPTLIFSSFILGISISVFNNTPKIVMNNLESQDFNYKFCYKEIICEDNQLKLNIDLLVCSIIPLLAIVLPVIIFSSSMGYIFTLSLTYLSYAEVSKTTLVLTFISLLLITLFFVVITIYMLKYLYIALKPVFKIHNIVKKMKEKELFQIRQRIANTKMEDDVQLWALASIYNEISSRKMLPFKLDVNSISTIIALIVNSYLLYLLSNSLVENLTEYI
jgi:hypothetical protein